MPNRILTNDELQAACREQARVWHEPWRAMAGAARVTAPLPEQFPSMDEYYRAIIRYNAVAQDCRHCWHAPRDWQQGTSQIPPPRLCCWCGANEGPPHGPYAP